MKTTIFIVCLALTATFAKEEVDKKTKKRGVFGEGLGHGFDYGHGGLASGHSSVIDHGIGTGYSHGSGYGGYAHGSGYGGYGDQHGPIDLGAAVHQHITITKKVGIPFPQPYPVHVEKKIPVAVPHPVPVPVDKPYPVHVPKPYPVPVEKPVPYTVVKHVPYPVKVPIRVPYKVPVAVPVPKPYPVTVHKPVPVHIPEPVIIKKPVPIYVKGHHDAGLGSYGHAGSYASYGSSYEGRGDLGGFGHHY